MRCEASPGGRAREEWRECGEEREAREREREREIKGREGR